MLLKNKFAIFSKAFLPVLILFSTSLFKCANISSPSGGPKDTIPPIVIRTLPENKQLNFKGQEIVLEFDELINADKLKSELSITPTYSGKYTHIVKKNKVTIKLEDPLEDSTTYTFTFNNSIVDITEKQPAENLILAFSTTDYIDSLHITGT
ncbi:MAG: Ig-like domain-containing protein, partial [Cyclobacteriaceae bacterium]|nr:Ig-like domain-containing protein [Cyclobacteriaceae bacterium]